MLGFPIASLVEHLKVLTDNGITVVIIDQITFPPEQVIRKITGIYTSGTNLLAYTSDNNYILSIFIKEEKQINGKCLIVVGMSAGDLTTGKLFINESYSTYDDEKLSLDETARFIHTYYPREILLHMETTKYSIEYIKNYLELENVIIRNITELNTHYTKLNYQIEVLKKVFPNYGIISPIEYIGMERMPYSMISFMILLDYINSINPSLLGGLSLPKIFCSQPTLHI